MIKFFRKIRQQLIKENKLRNYLLYAIGEIVLVVIGILIALQINNANEARKIKIKELNYLTTLKVDLQLNLNELNDYIEKRNTSISSAGVVLDFIEGRREINPNEFNFHNLNVQIWQPFNQNDNTYLELVNSGNLEIISNDTIRHTLLDMQLGYKNIAFVEGHMRHDFENYIYTVYFSIADLDPALKDYAFQVSDGAAGEKVELSTDEIDQLSKNQTFKNGFVLSIFNNNLLIAEYNQMIKITDKLIGSIDSELKKYE